VDLKLAQCGESGDGSFSWLIRFDSQANTITTGGAPPSSDPLGAGYCFVNLTLPSGLDLKPVTVSVTKNADGSYDSAPIAHVDIPIYYLAVTPPQIIVLPVSGGAIKGLQFNSDGDCIGSLDTSALDNNCAESDPTTCSKWRPHASIAGYITLEEADKVNVPLAGRSLCSLLTGNSSALCPRDSNNKITAKGDYCSTSNKAGDCQDSSWLAAVFAASAVKITDGAGVQDCQGSGSGSGSGGTDAGGD
jgi:hypothetical protein